MCSYFLEPLSFGYAVARKRNKFPFKLKSSFYNYCKHNLFKKLPAAMRKLIN